MKHQAKQRTTSRRDLRYRNVLWLAPGLVFLTLALAVVVASRPAPLRLATVSMPISPLSGGIEFVVSGSGFTVGSPMQVLVGGRAATRVKVLTERTLAAVAPPGADGAADVEVRRKDGATARLAATFHYSAHLPQMFSANPLSGPKEGGTAITISGANFEPGAKVWFGNVMAPSVTLLSEHELVAVTPPGYEAGQIDLTVANPNGEETNEGDFDYE